MSLNLALGAEQLGEISSQRDAPQIDLLSELNSVGVRGRLILNQTDLRTGADLNST